MTIAPTAEARLRLRTGRPRLGVAVVFSIAVALLLLAGASAAAPVQRLSVTRDTAPYAGEGYGLAGTSSSGCGVKGSLPVAPDFDTSTGRGVEWAKVVAGKCGSTGNSYELDAEAGIESDNLTGVAGFHNLTIHVGLSFIANMSANGGVAQASFLVFPVLALLDMTNGSTYYGNAGGISDSITVGSYYHQFNNTKLLGYLDFDFKRNHVYQWEVLFVIDLGVTTGASGGGALAWVDMGAHGQHADLESVLIH